PRYGGAATPALPQPSPAQRKARQIYATPTFLPCSPVNGPRGSGLRSTARPRSRRAGEPPDPRDARAPIGRPRAPAAGPAPYKSHARGWGDRLRPWRGGVGLPQRDLAGARAT